MEADNAASRLCAACGMCCNGVLFHIVRLQAEDSAKELTSLGLKLKSKHAQPYFKQPCAAYCDWQCSIYAQRPKRCRVFQCRQLQSVNAGELAEAAALKTIREAVLLVSLLGTLLERSGETNYGKPLTRRYEDLVAEPPDVSRGSEALALREQVISAMQKLETLLENSFRLS